MAIIRIRCVHLKSTSRVVVAIGLVAVLLSLSGCCTTAPATTLSYTMSKNQGSDPALKIDDLTTIVFVGLDCKSGTSGEIRVSEGDSIRSGKSTQSGGVETQSVHGIAKLIVQKGEGESATYYTFTINDEGKRLVYKDNSYTIGDGPKTIVIAEDGTATLKGDETP